MILPDEPDKLKSMSDDEIVAAYGKMGISERTARAYIPIIRGEVSEPVN